MRKTYDPAPGMGTMYSKPTPDAVILSGTISLPEHGKCWINGVRSKLDAKMELTVKRASDRVEVAKITMPSTNDPVRRGVITHEKGRWRIVGTMRTGASGPYLQLFMPEVASPLF